MVIVSTSGGDKAKLAAASALLRAVAPVSPDEWAAIAGGSSPPSAVFEVGGQPTVTALELRPLPAGAHAVDFHVAVPGCPRWADASGRVVDGVFELLAIGPSSAMTTAQLSARLDPSRGGSDLLTRWATALLSGVPTPACTPTPAGLAARLASCRLPGSPPGILSLWVTLAEAAAAAGRRPYGVSCDAMAALGPAVVQPIYEPSEEGRPRPTGRVARGVEGGTLLLQGFGSKAPHRRMSIDAKAVLDGDSHVGTAFVLMSLLSEARERERLALLEEVRAGVATPRGRASAPLVRA